MKLVALAFCGFIAVMGVLGMVAPQALVAFVRRFQSPAGLWAAAGLRLLMGASLYLAAPDARSPGVIRGFGVFIFAAGVVTPMFGVRRFEAMLDWWVARGPTLIRVWSGFALLLALALLHWLGLVAP